MLDLLRWQIAYTVDVGGTPHFVITGLYPPSTHITLSFEGAMQSDGNLSGSFCNLNQEEQCAGAYSVWSMGPAL
jgi:hypothetical protein